MWSEEAEDIFALWCQEPARGRQCYRFTLSEARLADTLPVASHYKHWQSADITLHTRHYSNTFPSPVALIRNTLMITPAQISACVVKVKPPSSISHHIHAFVNLQSWNLRVFPWVPFRWKHVTVQSIHYTSNPAERNQCFLTLSNQCWCQNLDCTVMGLTIQRISNGDSLQKH